MKISLNVMLATIALAIGSFMNILDMTIVNTALSHIAGDFAVPPNQATWVITSYAVAEAIMLPITGWMANRFGGAKLFLTSTILFTTTSLLCGLSLSFEMLLVMRILQGIVGASMIPLAQSLMMGLYPVERRGMAMGLWAMTAVTAPILGPILGGWITDQASWRWTFYINIPFGLLTVYLVSTSLKSLGHQDTIQRTPIDWVGFVLLCLGVGSLQVVLDKGNDLDWFDSGFICILALASFVFMTIFVLWEKDHPYPIVNLKYFKNKNFNIGILTLSIGVSSYFATVVLLPLWLQNYMGYTAFISGLTTSTTGIFIVLLSPILGFYMHKFDARKLVVFGFTVFFLISLLNIHLPPDVTDSFIAFNRLFLGLGLVFFFLPLTSITFSEIPSNEIASASGISNFMRNMGSSFGTSLVVSIWERRQALHHEQMVGYVYQGNPALNDFSNLSSSSLPYINNIISSQAALTGINEIMLLSGVIMLCLIPLVLLANKHKVDATKMVMEH